MTAGGEKRKVKQGEIEDLLGVAFVQGIEEPAIPEVHRIQSAKVEEDDEENRAGERPGEIIPSSPEACCTAPKPSQQIAPSRSFGSAIR